MAGLEFVGRRPGQTGAAVAPGRGVGRLLDPPLLVGRLLLMFGGLTVLYSAGGESLEMVIRQCVRFSAGLTALFLLAQIPPRSYRFWAPFLYCGGPGLLVLVLIAGTEANGAQRRPSFPGIGRFQTAHAVP